MTTEAFIAANLDATVSSVELPDNYAVLHRGKVRDTFVRDGQRIICTSDRQSAFDRILAEVPFKGQVLNSISAWWFSKTAHICDNHLIATPDPAVSICKSAKVFPVEFVLRGYMTGSTDTSIWVNYDNGVRNYCGVALPEGLGKNDKLTENIITPTTKADDHDELITPAQIVERGLMSQSDWDTVSAKALELFAFGQQVAAQRGLILVDTKLEFGKDDNGNIILVDEVFTPDSSRYWLADTYAKRIAAGQEPQNFDKEFLRLWFVDHCDPYADKQLPDAPIELVTRLAHRYITAFEMITGEEFTPQLGGSQRIAAALDGYFEQSL